MKNRHIQIGLLFVAVCLFIGLAIAFVTTPRASNEAGNASTAVVTNTAMPVTVPPLAEALKGPAEASSDFLVTDELLRDKPKWEDLGQGPNGASFCKGDSARLTNGSDKTLNLNLVVSESDVSAPLGSVQAGHTLKFDPGDVGTWNIVDAGDGGPLFQYEVTTCSAQEAAKPEPVSSDAEAARYKQGKCRLTVDGKRLIDGACFYALQKGGGFEIADTTDYTGYVAYLDRDDGGAEGMWNGRRGGPNVNNPLGTMARQGACWTAENNELCLWAS